MPLATTWVYAGKILGCVSGLCQLLVQFEAYVDFGLDVIEGLQAQLLDRLYEEASNVKYCEWRSQ